MCSSDLEVHRQAADNPIVRMSMIVREGGRLERGIYGESRVIARSEIDPLTVTRADQVLVGLNRTRRAYNRRLRELRGLTGVFPEVDDKLVCLRNDRKKGLLNGGIWKVKAVHAQRRNKLRLSLVPEEEPAKKPTRVGIIPAFFESEEEIPWSLRKESDEFDYGYALTVHKAQGSQWDDVVLFDESGAFREHRARWLYTGLTRAAKKLTVVV